ncbi:hypothetical protein DDD64_07350 [Actinotignum sanguinis]|uniref:hypothetical protein n=1 Tax=Actinotignum sanguinis TaxID=1445614 RepID=UPI000F7FA837|nr:hypothetical protein [Actinotignum sanguinis]MDY5148188.1 hypothetical protein [Actinotignum sanguinis]RTE48153.1 hypothetical protein DDD64_07350 [Actinotignum sanguinis]
MTGSLDEIVADFAENITATGRLFDESFAVHITNVRAPRKGGRILRGYLKLRDPMCVKRMLYLGITYELFVKSPEKFLTVERSSFALHLNKTTSEPLVRWDYNRNPRSKDIPLAHLQIHAHRDAWTHVMLEGGATSRRARKRAIDSSQTPTLSELHFPVGGKRFRPSLEEVLLFLISELGVSCEPQTKCVLESKQSEWEKIQARAVVRTHPDQALIVLRELGMI